MKRTNPNDRSAHLFSSSPGRRLTLLKAAWVAAVGPDLARRSEVVALDGDLLRIRVPDGSWRRSLWRMRRDLLGRLRKIAGSAAPRTLGFSEGQVVASLAPEPAPPAPSVIAPLPPIVAAAADQIEDPEIRERFREAAGRYFGRFVEGPPQATDKESD
jgi:hypothetical protein